MGGWNWLGHSWSSVAFVNLAYFFAPFRSWPVFEVLLLYLSLAVLYKTTKCRFSKAWSCDSWIPCPQFFLVKSMPAYPVTYKSATRAPKCVCQHRVQSTIRLRRRPLGTPFVGSLDSSRIVQRKISFNPRNPWQCYGYRSSNQPCKDRKEHNHDLRLGWPSTLKKKKKSL